jgi:hypothetical protein
MGMSFFLYTDQEKDEKCDCCDCIISFSSHGYLACDVRFCVPCYDEFVNKYKSELASDFKKWATEFSLNVEKRPNEKAN